jgi:hypothetical protein
MKNYPVINLSTVVTTDQFTKMIKAINTYLSALCNDWTLQPIQLVASTYNSRNILPNTIFILDTTDSADALGYHFDNSGSAIGKVFAKTIIQYGGVVLYKDNTTMTVAQCLCHELLEMIGNPNINKWFLDNNGIFWAGELCDAVQNNLYVITLPGNVKVGLSDYVLPSYFSPNTVRVPFNKMNTLRSALTVDRYGYAITIQGNDIVPIYGSNYPEDKKVDVIKDIAEMRTTSKLFSK